ncbi:MAG: DNA-processing protein DprA [Planctomycetes bacterium]|nr:DNA-processing protein DprA [Planctomycetota bacterium]
MIEEDKLSIGIVGMRNPSFQGMECTKYFAGQLVQSGFTIVSGFARGIDIIAHESAINAGGRSLAFIGSGLLDVYPPENRDFIKEITSSGAIISEFPLKTPPDASNFPRRNRLIAAMSLGTLVIEAGLRSGALITARLAAEYGREVFAMPGRYNDPNSLGCNMLIQDGVKMVLKTEDILSELPAQWVNTEKTSLAAKSKRKVDLFGQLESQDGSLDETQKKLLEIITTEPLHIEKIASVLNLKSPQVLASLVMLEIKGLVKQLAGKFFVKI